MLDLAVFLLVDDNEDDCLLLRRAFVKAKVLNPIQVVNSGQEAIDYLSGIGKYKDRCEYPSPTLLLLDLKMPRMSGLDVLRWIRENPTFKGLRVVMLSGSETDRAGVTAFEEQRANGTNPTKPRG